LTDLVQQAYARLVAGDLPIAHDLLQRALALSGRRAGPGAQLPAVGSDAAPAARIVVRTLGEFGLCVDGTPIPSGKKPARRTVALLKAVIALGGREVCRCTIADALWPDLDGDRANNALEVALHRLRARLAVPRAITSREGRLSLDPDLVWVDAFAFDAASRAVTPAGGYAPVERAFALYRGAFLPEESGSAWSARMRERLRARFVSIVAGAAAALEARERFDDAMRLYERGIAADELVCAFHDGLIRCLGRAGRAVEAQALRRRMELLQLDGMQ
jgi:DNA-binding SARP family transcriptional activator